MKREVLLLLCVVSVSYHQQQTSQTKWPLAMQNHLVYQYPYYSQVIEGRTLNRQSHPSDGNVPAIKRVNKYANHVLLRAAMAILGNHPNNRRKTNKISTEVIMEIVPTTIRGKLVSTELCLDRRLFSTVYRDFKRRVLTQPCKPDKRPGLDEDDDDRLREISPSPVEPFDATNEPTNGLDIESLLASSKNDDEFTDDDESITEIAEPRYELIDRFAVVLSVTSTKTKTIYSLTKTKVRSTVHLSDESEILGCLPNGHVLCD